ncbi:MAG TPA: carbamate kinase [Candidatus Dormibacteraeota bacterium]|nr:carbamate kinase [Candidatus Dormibacteraeota bacterium]
MRVVAALGGNALLRRGQALTAENQRENVQAAARALVPVAAAHELVVTHGNGPQVGLLALQSDAYKEVGVYPLDVLGAESEGMIGYLLEQELGNLLPEEQPFATILTQVEVDAHDPAFAHPTKPIGPIYAKEEAERLAAERGWSIARDGDHWRRVVPSPRPLRIFEIRVIELLVRQGVIVISTGGGGIPTVLRPDGILVGVEAVIDKDRAGSLLARSLDADAFLMLTDVDGVYLGWGTPERRRVLRAHPDALEAHGFASGSMGPKVEAAIEFARATQGTAAVGSLEDAEALLSGRAGTSVSRRFEGLELA